MVGGDGGETKVTTVTDDGVPKVCVGTKDLAGELVEVAERASAGTARIAAGATCACRSGRGRGTLGRHSEHAELRVKLLALTLGALGLVASENQGFKLVLAILADVFENRH
jgi:hypothetical protein